MKPLQQVHAHIITSGVSGNIFLCNRLVNSYAFCGLMAKAQIIFSQILYKNLVSWTVLVSGFTKNGLYIEAIEAFHEMIIKEIKPNELTIASVLPAFGKLGFAKMGKSVHCYWIRKKFKDNIIVETAFVDMYSKFGCTSVARYVFDKMSVRNVVSWNAIISGYSDNGFGDEAVSLFKKMKRKGFYADVFTMMSLVSACLSMEDIRVGTGVHGLIIRSGYVNDQLLRTFLMQMYISGNSASDAYCIFDEIPIKDVVAWTLMLSGFTKSGESKRSVEHLNKMMRVDGILLDSVSLVSILSGCSCSGALQHGRRVHALVIKAGFESDVFVGSSIIDMYANCGNMEDAKRYFEWMEEKDIVCWNALISGYGMNGYGNFAIDLFMKIKGSGLIPDGSTMVSILCACSHAGLVDQGLEIFNQMVANWSIVPSLKHYVCVIDLLARAGRLDDAYALMKRMDVHPDIYSALLSACQVHKNVEMGIKISRKLFESRPNDVGQYVLLSNMYALAGNWDDAKSTRIYLRSRKLKKEPGFSSTEID
ncbi:pentatricopeptide repeat-containing At3g57430, chloroplastic [Olea europaea subsp. europaea]|uniref:Pentatricopeptide repeat-containing At3g57430, chloroplastic n=1 Tax=Olea europaea subsp. europaea TaxID=158383 RepID=A0A8S0PCN3_OLEEU|nr:pentatricopeptide repeat-containing At3g57430, chloroplastic [Olea europaea subsp. europaea]